MQRDSCLLQVIYSSIMYYKLNCLSKTYNAVAIPHVIVWLSLCKTFPKKQYKEKNQEKKHRPGDNSEREELVSN